jgi:hypothetical protein
VRTSIRNYKFYPEFRTFDEYAKSLSSSRAIVEWEADLVALTIISLADADESIGFRFFSIVHDSTEVQALRALERAQIRTRECGGRKIGHHTC